MGHRTYSGGEYIRWRAPVTVTVDEENAGEEFWDAVRESEDAAVAVFAQGEGWGFTSEQWAVAEAALSKLPGWTGGPDYAPHPVVVVSQ